MLDIGKLRELIAVYPSQMRVTTEQGEDIVHIVNQAGEDRVILSTSKPIGHCSRCGGYVYPTKSCSDKGYAAYCPTHDEDLFTFEFEALEEDNAPEDF